MLAIFIYGYKQVTQRLVVTIYRPSKCARKTSTSKRNFIKICL